MNKKEYILIAGLLILGLLSYFFMYNIEPGAMVKIEVSQKLYGTYALNKDQEILVKDSKGVILCTSEIKDGSIRVKSSTCTDKICIKEGEISSSGQTIICLPNQVVITVINEKEQIDGVLK